MDQTLNDAAARAVAYLDGRHERPVFPSEADIAALGQFVEELPETGTAAPAVIEMLDEIGSPGTVTSTGGRYFGFVVGSAYPVGVGAAWLTSAWDQNSALKTMSPTASALDAVAGSWLKQLLGLPVGAQHQFVSGTSNANALCLAVGRDALLHDAGWDSVDKGLFGAPPIQVVVSEAAHSSVTKALGFVGLGRSAVTTVPADNQGRMITSELPPPGPPTLVIAQAGNVNTGAFDPFESIADHYRGSPHWTHIDGAFGLWAATSSQRKYLMRGAEHAHSWATDMHKWLNTTYDSAVAVVSDRADMARTFHVGASYIPDSDRLEPVSRGMEMSQRARAVETWAVLKFLGKAGIADLSDQMCAHAVRLAALLANGGVTVLNDVVLNQILVCLDHDDATEALLTRIQESGSIWCGGSQWHGRPVIRISVSSHVTTTEDIETTAETILQLASAL